MSQPASDTRTLTPQQFETSTRTADVAHVLAADRRCHVIQILAERDEPIQLADLADQITAHETGEHPHEIDSRDRKNVYCPLYQNHIPKLEEHKVVEADGRLHLIQRGSEFRRYHNTLTAMNDITLSGGDA